MIVIITQQQYMTPEARTPEPPNLLLPSTRTSPPGPWGGLVPEPEAEMPMAAEF